MSFQSRVTVLGVFLIALGCAAPPHGEYSRTDSAVSVRVRDQGGRPVAGATFALDTGEHLEVATTGAVWSAKASSTSSSR